MRSHYSAADFYRYDPGKDTDPLCCCEYFDRNAERNHLLACCCIDLDDHCDSLINGPPIDGARVCNMLLTFQDRLRIPWRGGAKQITLDNVLPIVFLVSMQLLAAINLYCTVVVFTVLPLLLLYLKRLLGRMLPKTNFFSLWFICSALYLVALFECTLPLLEIMPQENIVFILFVTLSTVCYWRTGKRAVHNHVSSSYNKDDGGESLSKDDSASAILISDREDSDDGSDGRLACQTCRKYVPPRTYHCKVCSTCIIKQDHHSVWLNCCIGKANHCLYLFGCLFSVLALLLFANLSLTAVCHPVPIFTIYDVTVMIPDDCTDIYFQYDIALCFTGAIYALIMAFFILVSLLRQFCLISCGVTDVEWHKGEHANRRNCFVNWKTFCLGQ